MSFFLFLVAMHRAWIKPLESISSVRLIASSTIGMAGGGLALGLYNHALTGNFFTSGYEALHGAPHNPGFHIDPYGPLSRTLESDGSR
jgi:hypothetical protein